MIRFFETRYNSLFSSLTIIFPVFFHETSARAQVENTKETEKTLTLKTKEKMH